MDTLLTVLINTNSWSLLASVIAQPHGCSLNLLVPHCLDNTVYFTSVVKSTQWKTYRMHSTPTMQLSKCYLTWPEEATTLSRRSSASSVWCSSTPTEMSRYVLKLNSCTCEAVFWMSSSSPLSSLLTGMDDHDSPYLVMSSSIYPFMCGCLSMPWLKKNCLEYSVFLYLFLHKCFQISHFLVFLFS